MKNFLRKIWIYPILVIWFVLSVIGFEYILNKGNTDMTKEMSAPSLPVISMRYDGHDYNRLYGYTDEMNFSLIRDGITPLGEGRSLALRIYKKEADISKVSYELRSIDKDRFIEQKEVTDFTDNGDTIDFVLNLQDLILPNVDYSLRITVKERNGREDYYYARIVKNDDLDFDEKVDFVYNFSNWTFNKEIATDVLPTYLESNKSGDNTNYNYVNIHSSLDQVTWGNLYVKKVSEPVCTVLEIDNKSAIMTLEYLVNAGTQEDQRVYNVSEYYRIQKGKDRMHLMEYERRMDSVIFGKAGVVFNDKLMLGISSDDFEMAENDDGSTVAFVNSGALYIVNSSRNIFVTGYSFYDSDHFDERGVNLNHDIKILNIDEAGNVTFVVYGYFNSGDYEGKVGINIFEYNSRLNVIEEKIFIPYDKPFEILKMNVNKLSFLDGNGYFYFYLDGKVLKTGNDDGTVEVIAENLEFDELYVSKGNNIIAWPSKGRDTKVTAVTVMTLDDSKQFVIKCASYERINVQGFMGEDIIYGIADEDDIIADVFGNVTFAMKEINILNRHNVVVKNYAEEEYVTKCTINENLITLSRVVKNEDGGFESTSPDSIVNTQMVVAGKNSKEVVATENLKKIIQISLKNEMDNSKTKYMNPKVALYEGHKEIEIDCNNSERLYYSFKGKTNLGCFKDESEAVRVAEANLGCVMDNNGLYVWKKENRADTNQIMRITGKTAIDENVMACCIETILEYEGFPLSAKADLAQGLKPAEILEKNIENCEALEFVNVSEEAILYYINRDIPVIVNAGDETVLLVGYSKSVHVWMNPVTGEIMKVPVEEARKLYERYGYRFTVYVINKS